jgi:hypothetical protein
MAPVSRFRKNQRTNRCIAPHARIIVVLSPSNPFDLVPGTGKGSYDRLGLPHCEQGINCAPPHIIAFSNGTSDQVWMAAFSAAKKAIAAESPVTGLGLQSAISPKRKPPGCARRRICEIVNENLCGAQKRCRGECAARIPLAQRCSI